MSDNGEDYGRNAYSIAVPEDESGAVYAVVDPIGEPMRLDGAVPLPHQDHGPEWDVWASKLVDLKGVAKPPEFRGEDSE
eukprot:15357813-Heterocapsa_arctica.AAC.1